MNENNFPNIFEEDSEPNNQDLLPVKKLEKSKTDYIISGVCAGIAKYFNTEPPIIRAFAILALLFGWLVIIAYLLAAFLLPSEKNPSELTEEEKARLRRLNLKATTGSVLIYSGIYFGFVSFGIFSLNPLLAFNNSYLFSVVSIIIGVFILFFKTTNHGSIQNQSVKNFNRSEKEKIFFGICGGFSKYVNLELTTVRIILIILTMITLGIFGIVYLYLGLTTKTKDDNNE
jgi:phage shock protein PspC (stress-responsive transcriptional regulator)